MARSQRILQFTSLSLSLCLLAAAPSFAEDKSANRPPANKPAPATPEKEAPAPRVSVEDVLKGLADKDASKRLVAANQAKDLEDKRLPKALIKLLKDDQRIIRDAAVQALGARKDAADKKTSASALHKRLAPLEKSPANEAEQLVVIQALHDLAQPHSVKPLIDGISSKTSIAVSEARLMAVGNIPTAEAIEELITFQSKGRKRGSNGGRQNAQKALRYATGQKLPNDPDAWRSWWKQNAKTFDFRAAKEQREVDAQKRDDREERKENNRRKREERENDKNDKNGKNGNKLGKGGKSGGQDDAD